MAISVTDGTITIYPLAMTVYSTTRASTTIAHPIIGRTSGIPDITWGAMGPRTGTLIFVVQGYANALALESLHTEQNTLTFKQDEITGMGWPYALVGNLAVELTDIDNALYTVSVDFVETA